MATDGCAARLTNTSASLELDGATILTTAKPKDAKLWRITPADFQQQAHANYAKVPNWQSIQQHVAWAHQCLGSPTKSMCRLCGFKTQTYLNGSF